ncbi:MAG: hypothetical protein OT477_13520 [Chloroflexi bacterium]|nr:hypothetical protein [Chloroflexota bacterium]
MTQFIAFDPESKIWGRGITVLITACQSQGLDVEYYLKNFGLTEANADSWWPFQTALDILAEMRVREGNFMGLIAVGHAGPAFQPWPDEITTVEQAFLALDSIAQMAHQGYIGRYVPEMIDPQHIRVTSYTAYPSDFEYGLMYGIAQRFLPQGTSIVIHRFFSPSRLRGDDHCVFDVTWELKEKNWGRMPGRL